MTPRPDPRGDYRALVEGHRAKRLDLESAARRLGTVRFIVFFAALAPWVASELFVAVPGAAGWLSLPFFGFFALLVSRHRALRSRLARAEVAERLAEDGLARLDRRWDDLPPPPPTPPEADKTHPWSGDLDLFGRASLRSLLGPVFTPMGRARLDGWLLGHPDFAQARSRQAAVREIAARADVRESAAVEGALADAVESEALARFLTWCEAPSVVPAWLGVAAWVLPPLTLAMALADIFGWIGGWAWFVPLMAQAILAWRWGARLHEHFGRASSGVPGLRRYHRLLSVWEGCRPEAPALEREIGTLTGPGETASSAVERLDRWLTLADSRFSSLHPVLAVGLLWDFHVARQLDGWRASAGLRAADWMQSLGTLEALTSLGTLAADHPDWCFPDLASDDSTPLFEAEGLGHPLLGDEVGVRNDVTLGPPGRVLLITGSNMAGKSTLLRSLGLGVVLAGMGAPVCARRLRLVEGRLFTSMRVQDSIEAGVSFFMAELERLAALLRAAPEIGSDEPPLIFLVDEILQGTNSEERRIAGRRLVRHLLRRRAIGAVTTHDLEFHRHPEIEAAAELAHFRESVDAVETGEALSFDYRLRPGLATTRNALRLAERVGLTDPDPSPSPPAGSDDRGITT